MGLRPLHVILLKVMITSINPAKGIQSMTTDISILSPTPLTRSITGAWADVVGASDDDEKMAQRYLDYECNYRRMPGDLRGLTWRAIKDHHPDTFVSLMTHDVSTDSKTFQLFQRFLTPEQRQVSSTTVKYQDSPEGIKERQERYLDLPCTHKGRMNGKTWREIRTKDYSYFVWSVGNSMGRDTKSYKSLLGCLNPTEQQLVEDTPKGQVRVSRSVKYVE
jgi:hypothetical protein